MRATAGGSKEIDATSISRLCTPGRLILPTATATVAAKNRMIVTGTIGATRT